MSVIVMVVLLSSFMPRSCWQLHAKLGCRAWYRLIQKIPKEYGGVFLVSGPVVKTLDQYLDW